jgi:hypothetical protein
MSDPGENQNCERKEQKEIERVRKLIAPVLDPVEHTRHRISFFQSARHDSTELLARREAVKKKMAPRSEILTSLRLTVLECMKSEAKDFYDKRSMIEDPSV